MVCTYILMVFSDILMVSTCKLMIFRSTVILIVFVNKSVPGHMVQFCHFQL